MINQELIQTLIVSDISGNITAEEKSQLKLILMESEDARKLYQELYDILSSDESIRAIAELPSQPPVPPPAEHFSVIHGYKAALAVAAMLTIAVVTFYFNRQQPLPDKDHVQLVLNDGTATDLDKYDSTTTREGKEQQAYDYSGRSSSLATLTVPKMKQHTLILQDGSRVMLNADTKVRFPQAFDKAYREIWVEGAAYIEVAKNPGKPFLVHMPNGIVRVLGTKFNVSTYDGQEKVSLADGSVKYITRNDSVTLLPGQEAVLQAGLAIKVNTFNVQEIAEQQEGIYTFDGVPLKDFAGIIRRFYNKELILDDRVKDIKYTCNLNRHNTLEQFLTNIKDVDITTVGDTIYIRP